LNHAAHAVLRPSGSRRGVAAAVAFLAVASGCVLVVPAHAAGARVPESQPLVELLHDHVARSKPDERARRIETVAARRPLTRPRTVLPVLDSATGSSGRTWVQVLLPGRPSGHKGWIHTDETNLTSTEWLISIDLSARRVTAYRDGRVERRFRAVVGAASTPTPRGRFFVEEVVALSAVDAGGPFALATSARSDVLQEFNGGPGQIAIHGTNGLYDALGTAASHGCIRLSTAAITWLASRIGGGVPLTVSA
jgi:lipoprotein-anchoring transpeptidase ErfK/SrfK